MGAPGEDDAWGGVLGVTKGLYARFPGRVIDTPISESAFVGAAAGAAASGLRPVAELMFVDFMGVCFDQIFNQAAKFRYMFGGKAETPMVIRTMCGAGIRAASQHSQALYPIFTHIPGLKVVVPSNALRRQGPADPGDPRRRPGHLLRAQGALHDWRATCPRRLHDPVRRGQHRARGRRRDDRRARPHGGLAAGGGRRARRDGIECEIIDPRTTRRSTRTRSSRASGNRAARRRRRGRPALRDGRGHRRAGRAAGFGALKARAADGHAAAHAGAVLAGARGPLRAGRRTDRGRGARGRTIGERTPA